MRTCPESESESNIMVYATCQRKIIQNSFIARGQLFSISCLMAIRKQLSDVCGLIIESKLPMPQLPTLNFQFLTVRLLSVDYLNQDRNQIHRLKS